MFFSRLVIRVEGVMIVAVIVERLFFFSPSSPLDEERYSRYFYQPSKRSKQFFSKEIIRLSSVLYFFCSSCFFIYLSISLRDT